MLTLLCAKCGTRRQLWAGYVIASGYNLCSDMTLVHKATYRGYINDPATIEGVLLCPKCFKGTDVTLVRVNSHYEVKEK